MRLILWGVSIFLLALLNLLWAGLVTIWQISRSLGPERKIMQNQLL